VLCQIAFRLLRVQLNSISIQSHCSYRCVAT
jgi:hypothetical protein